MKRYFFFSINLLLLVGCCFVNVLAQDDIYYNPNNQYDTEYNRVDSYASNDSYATDDEYVYYDDDAYEYEYQARIRRFHQPNNGFGYYSGYYVDRYWYNPYNPRTWANSIYDAPFDPFYYNNLGFYTGFSWGWGNFWWRPRARQAFYGYGYNPYAYGAFFPRNYVYTYFNGYNPYCPATYVYNDITVINSNASATNHSHYGPRGGRSQTGGSYQGNNRPVVSTPAANTGKTGEQINTNYSPRPAPNTPYSKGSDRNTVDVDQYKFNRTGTPDRTSSPATRPSNLEKDVRRNNNFNRPSKPYTPASKPSYDKNRPSKIYSKPSYDRPSKPSQSKPAIEKKSRRTWDIKSKPKRESSKKEYHTPKKQKSYSKPSYSKPSYSKPSRTYSKPSTPRRSSPRKSTPVKRRPR